MSSADFKLDARVRDVPLPSGLLERLLALPYADDAGLDDVLRDVEMPEDFFQRLEVIPLADDAGLDEALRSVPISRELETTFRRHARRAAARREGRYVNRTLQISRIAMAASLIFAVSLSLGASLLLSWALNRSAAILGPQVTSHGPEAPRAKEQLETSWRMLADESPEQDRDQANHDIAVTRPSKAGNTGTANARREMELAAIEPEADRQQRERLALSTMPPNADPLAMPKDVVGSPNAWDDMPELPYSPADLAPHGLDWPLVKDSHREFLIEKGFHPFVVPAAGTALQSCSVPLAIEPSSYELARRYLERNELPPPNLVRTEEFLAAADYHFPKPPRRGLGLIVAGGPSPIGGDGYSLLQAGIQAWQGDDNRHAPMHVVLLIDTSTSMRWGSRMEIVRRSLAEIPGLLGPEDRLSLVTFNQAAHVLVENLGHDALSQFRAAADSLAAEGSTNFAGGLREACAVARESLGSGKPAVRLVLMTDGLLDFDPATAEKMKKQLSEAAQQSIRLDVIDLGQQKDSDPQLAAMAEAGHGTIHRAISAEQVRWALREIVAGRSQLVARSARLRVTFNPKAVLEYRLIGHESGDWAGLLPGPVDADFREGQAATGLFELRLDPNGADEVAVVELTWYVPGGDRTLAGKTMHRLVGVVRRNQFAGTMTGSAPWLQQAAVVAYTAEVLRHSPFIFARHAGTRMTAALHQALELALEVDSRALRTPAFEEFVALIRREMKAHPARRPLKD